MGSKKINLLLSICFLVIVLLAVGCSASLESPQETQSQSNQSEQNMLEVKENSAASSGSDDSTEDRSMDSPNDFLGTAANDGHPNMNEGESIPTSSDCSSDQLTESHETNDLFAFHYGDDLPFANSQSYLTLMNEANDRMIAIVANFSSGQILLDYAFLDVTDQAETYRNKGFVDMTDANGGDPCDGLIELWLIYPDGFVYGCYASPTYEPNNEYADYGGIGQIVISDGDLNANFRYGYLPTGVSAFISSMIEAK